MSPTDDPSSHGMFWIYTGLLVGAGISLYANIKYAFIPPRVAPPWWPVGKPWDPARYSPPTGALILAASWPVLLYITTEVMSWKGWLTGKGWALVRGLSMLLVAAPVANASYHHMSGLLRYYFPDDVLTVWLGPLAIDGAVLMCTAALQSKAQRRRMQLQGLPLTGESGGGAPASPAVVPSPASLTGEARPLPVRPDAAASGPPVTLTGGAEPEAVVSLDGVGLTGEVAASTVASPVGVEGWPAVPAGRGSDPARSQLLVEVAGGVATWASWGPGSAERSDAPPGVELAPARSLTGDGPTSPVRPSGQGVYADASPVIPAGEASVADPGRGIPAHLTGGSTAGALNSPVVPSQSGGDLTGEAERLAVEAAVAGAGDKLSDAEVIALAWKFRPEGPFSANWLVSSFRVGTGRATRLYRTVLAPELFAKAALAGAADVGDAAHDGTIVA